MKKLLLETSFSKIYMIVMILISVLLIGGYFSYAMFTVSKEKSNAISIVTGNLTYKLEVDGEEGNTLTVPANSSKEFIVTLSNPNNRIARFNFYYLGDLLEGVDIGYIERDGYNPPPIETGINLEKVSTTGSSNTYIVRVANTTDSEISIDLGVSVGLDYNDLTLPSDGHLLRKITTRGLVSEVIEDDIMNRLNYEDSEQTFVTGSNPYNYIWYSGKLWRAVSINPNDNSVKLVTQWNISIVSYNKDGSTNFQDSYIEMWLNDTTVDGFLGNLREPDKFIVMDSVWDATMDSRSLGSITRPNGTTTVTTAVGLLNMYEYQSSNNGKVNGYLNDGLFWWTLTPYDNSSNVRRLTNNGEDYNSNPTDFDGVRPSINLKSSIKIVDGDGTEEDPYRLEGDNDTNLSGTLLNTRYSGEYITFGAGENNLYRIVSHETDGLTKITSAEPLKDDEVFKTMNYGNNISFSSTNTIGTFLNGDYLVSYVGDDYDNIIEDTTRWYLGTVGDGSSYKLAKYTDNNMSNYQPSIDEKVGLLRLGELMAGQFNRRENNAIYWTLTPYDSSRVRTIGNDSNAINTSLTTPRSIKPSLNLKSNVIITNGDGTKENPFEIELSN